MLKKLVSTLFLTLALGSVAFGQAAPPAPPQPGAVADAVIEAQASGADLAALHEGVDAWLVADELCRRGMYDEAAAFVGAGAGANVERLGKYVETRRAAGPEVDRAAQEVVERMNAALMAGDPSAALAASEELADEAQLTVPGMRVAYARGIALAQLRRVPEALEELTASVARVEAAGWLFRARDTFMFIGNTAFHAGLPGPVFHAWGEAIRVAELLEDLGSVSGMYMNMGQAHLRTGNLDAAKESYEKAIELERELGRKPMLAGAIAAIGVIHLQRGDTEAGRERLQEALAIQREIGDVAGIGRTLHNLSTIDFDASRYDEAIAKCQEAMKIARKLGDRAGYAGSLTSMARSQFRNGSFDEAEANLKLAMSELTIVGDRRTLALARVSLAQLYRITEQNAKALPLLLQSLAEQRAMGQDGAATDTQNTLGLVHVAMGNVAAAMQALQSSLDGARRSGRKTQVAERLNNLGTVYELIGEFDRAAAAYSEALVMHLELGNAMHVAGTRNNVGNMLLQSGRVTEALAEFQRALAECQAVDLRLGEAFAWLHIGRAQNSLGAADEALEAYENAIRISEELGDRRGAALAHTNVASLHLSAARYENAERRVAQALELLEESPHPLTHARATEVGAQSLLLQRKLEESADVAAAGIRSLFVLSAGLAEGEAAGLRESSRRLFEVGLRASLGKLDMDRACWFVEQGRSGSLREALGSREALETAVMPEALRRELAAARRASADALRHLRAVTGLKARREARDAWDASQTAVADAVARIEREAKAAAGVCAGVVDDLPSIQAALHENEALVSYAYALGDLVAVVVTRDTARHMLLPDSDRIDALVAAVELGDPAVDPTPALDALRKAVIDRLPVPASVDHIVVSPMGPLGYVPFAALLPDHVVTYAPSGTTLRMLRERESVGGHDVLAFGDPAYRTLDGTEKAAEPDASEEVEKPAEWIDPQQRDAARRSGGIPKLMRLPGTRAEVEAIGTRRILGEDATEATFAAELAKRSNWRALHLACHGLVDAERPMRSALALAPTATSDGLLTCFEIYGTPLDADLVVLSACQTGKGRVYRTEGIVGLTGAFLHAGGRGVLCSLWNVDDDATAALMKKFYALWNPADPAKAIPAAEALRQAQAHVRSHEAWSHPMYWAAWVLWGDSR